MAANDLFTQSGGDRRDKSNILLVFTDGKTNKDSKPYPDVLRPLQVSAGVVLGRIFDCRVKSFTNDQATFL